jgi:hypothetical protein
MKSPSGIFKIMLKSTALFVLLFGMLLFTGGCDKPLEKPDPNTDGHLYAPYSVGGNRVYQTDSIFFTKRAILIRDTVHCYILEQVRDSFITSSDQIVYEIDYYTAPSEDGPWAFADNGFIQISSDQLIRTEKGLDFIQLVFPVQRYRRWDGNARISNRNVILVRGEPFEPFLYWSGKSYYYQNILPADEISYEDDLINYIKSSRKYAWGVGMVYREFWMLKTSIDNASQTWAEKAEQGVIIRQSLIKNN